jgi:hypothetical protein
MIDAIIQAKLSASIPGDTAPTQGGDWQIRQID